jgi:hypothetical protein
MGRYKYLDFTQGLFLTINLAEQLLPGTFEFTLNHLINQMDLSVFDAAYHNNVKGASTRSVAQNNYLLLFTWDYHVPTYRVCLQNQYGRTRSRTTIPFVSSNAAAMKTLFSEVLLNCNELGLICGDLFAIANFLLTRRRNGREP